MNLLRRTRLLSRIIDKYSLVTYSVVQKSKHTQRKDQLKTRILNYFEYSNENDKTEQVLLINQREINHQTVASNIIVQNNVLPEMLRIASPEYNVIVESIETLLRPKQQSNNKISLNLIDDSCCKILSKLSPSRILKLLQLLTRARPNEVIFLKFYKHSLRALIKLIEIHRLNIQESLQLLFFEGLRKKQASRNVRIIINYLPPMSELSIMEQCIVAHAAFKCSVKLKDTKILEDVIEKNANELVKDPAILVTLCKSVRHAGPSRDCWLENLSKAIINSNETFTMKFAAHTLSLYAEAKLKCPDVLQRLFDDSMKNLMYARDIEIKRLAEPAEKDLMRVLWASSILNYKLRSSDTEKISSFIDKRYVKLSKNPFILANTLLFLWILDCRLKEIVVKCLKDKVFQPIIEEKELWKQIARLQLLLSCVKIESPEIALTDQVLRPYKVGIKIRTTVKRLRWIIDRLAEKLEIYDVRTDCPVDEIYISGVSFKLSCEKSIHIDLLDETTCLKSTTVPCGLMNLKLRLLNKIGFHSILIPATQLDDEEAVSSIIRKTIENIVQSSYKFV